MMAAFLLTQMFPGVVMAIPLYLLLDKLHLLDSLAGLILVYSTTTVPFATKDASGNLLPAAIPSVTLVKSARWQTDNDSAREPSSQVEILARLEAMLARPAPAGLVSEGFAPYGSSIAAAEAALDRVALSGFPVAQAARGDAHGFMQGNATNLRIEATNSTATKARILLMACLLKFGALPPAKDPQRPTPAEISAIQEKLKLYQAVFDTH